MAAAREYLSVISFSLTHRCDIGCAHCMPASGLGRTGDMVVSDLLDWIGQAEALNPSIRIAFTGGEPFLHRRALEQAAELCRRLGLPASVITNARWALSVEHAAAVLDRLPALRQIGVSVDAYHLAYVAPERIHHLVVAAHRLGRQVIARITYGAAMQQDIRAALAALEPVMPLIDSVETQPMIHTGRATEMLPPTEVFDFSDRPVPCALADAPAVEVDGHVYACCGPAMQGGRRPPLYLGDLNREPLTAIAARAQRSPVLQAIRTRGPQRLFADLARSTGRPAAPPRGHMCTTCIAACHGREWSVPLQDLQRDQNWVRGVAVEAAAAFGETGLLT